MFMLLPWRIASATAFLLTMFDVGSIFAQTADTGGGDVAEIGRWAAQIGFSAIFLWQWNEANKERKVAQAALVVLIERLAPVIEEATVALERVQTSMAQQVQRAEKPTAATTEEVSRTLTRMEALADDFARTLRRSRREADLDQ